MRIKVILMVLSAGFMFGGIGYADSSTEPMLEGFASYAGEDQAEFVADVNRSFAKDEEKLTPRRIKTLVKVNREAILSAPEEDRKKVLAEVFATLPISCFPELVEDFSAGIFKFTKGEKFKTNEDFTEFASASLMRIRQRLSRPDDDRAGARSVFATVMFLKAAGAGLAADLREPFMMFVLTGTHEIARKELIPDAMGDDKEKAPTLASITNVGYRAEAPVHPIAFQQGGMMEYLNLLVGSDLRVKNAFDVSSPDLGDRWPASHPGMGAGVHRVPRVPSTVVPRDRKPPKTAHDDDDMRPWPYLGQTL